MRIGIDLQVLAQKPWAGVGNYAYHLAEALRKLKTNHEFVFLIGSPVIPDLIGDPDLPSTAIGGLDSRFRGNDKVEIISLPKKSIPFWSSHVTCSRIMQRTNLDVLHGPANVFPMGVKGGRGLKLILTLHDLAIYRHPEWFPCGQWLSTKIVVPRSIKKSDHIIVPSQATKKDLMEMFRVAEEKITVVPHGVSESFFVNGQRRESLLTQPSPPQEERDKGRGGAEEPKPTRLPALERSNSGQVRAATPYNDRRYILFVGTLEPRKNVNRLIEAYKALPKDILEEYDLVIAGSRGWGPPLSQSLPTGGGGKVGEIHFLDYVPDDQLPALYQTASIFVYPSLYEGFGMPVLEAMAAGVPVVTSHQVARNIEYRISNIDPHSTFHIPHSNDIKPLISVDPNSTEEINRAITTLIRDTAYLSQISAAGQDLARQFTWERTAKETLKIYEKFH